MYGCLLVTNQDVRERFLLIDFVVDHEHRAAWIAKYIFDTFGFKSAAENFCSAQDFRSYGRGWTMWSV